MRHSLRLRKYRWAGLPVPYWRRWFQRRRSRRLIAKLCDRMRDMQCPGDWCFQYEGGDGYFGCALRDGEEPVRLRDPSVRPEHTRIGPDQLHDHFDTGYDEYWRMEFPSDAEFELWEAPHWCRDSWRRDRYARREKGRQREARRKAWKRRASGGRDMD